jgi:hypothetical protein
MKIAVTSKDHFLRVDFYNPMQDIVTGLYFCEDNVSFGDMVLPTHEDAVSFALEERSHTESFQFYGDGMPVC